MDSSSNNFRKLLNKVALGETLSAPESQKAFDIMMKGEATPAQMGGFLMGLRVRGETVDEIIGGANAMRSRALKVNAPAGAVDTCGTGGDNKETFNISTAAAIVTASCGVTVAKHGNKAVSSNSGSADILTALGVNIDADVNIIQKSFREVGIGFLLAPRHHGAMRHVGPSRLELGTRTIFNLLGPLSNPANVKHQVIGVFDKYWAEPLATVLLKLGSENVWIINGSDGMDELTTTGPSNVVELKNGNIQSFKVDPTDAGLPRAKASQLKGGDPNYNAQQMLALLNGTKGPIRDIVLFNAAAALIVSGKVGDLKEGVQLAARSIDSGAAQATLKNLIAVTNGPS